MAKTVLFNSYFFSKLCSLDSETICKNSSYNCFIEKVISILLFIAYDVKPKISKAFGVKFWINKQGFVNTQHFLLISVFSLLYVLKNTCSFAIEAMKKYSFVSDKRIFLEKFQIIIIQNLKKLMFMVEINQNI